MSAAHDTKPSASTGQDVRGLFLEEVRATVTRCRLEQRIASAAMRAGGIDAPPTSERSLPTSPAIGADPESGQPAAKEQQRDGFGRWAWRAASLGIGCRCEEQR